jgi:Dockerin type I domain
VIGRPQPSISLQELRAVVAHVRALQPESRRPSRAHIWAYAAFLVILLGSVRAETPRAYLPSSLNPIEESRMRTLQSLGVVSSFAIASVATAQSAVQWRVEDGGNGHWYRIRREQTPICWEYANTQSTELGGHLVSITSGAEQIFVANLSQLAFGSNAIELGPWIGANCGGAPWGQWSWSSGERYFFENWLPTAPNPGWNEEYVHFWRWGDARWNDAYQCGIDQPTSVHGFVTEWDADCNGDGVVDFGQVESGEFSDADGNKVPDCCQTLLGCCPGDVDRSGAVNGVDLAAVLNNWGTNGGKYPGADTNQDGIVDGIDLAQVLGGWGPCT